MAAVLVALLGSDFMTGPVMPAVVTAALAVGFCCRPVVAAAATLVAVALMTTSSQISEPTAYTVSNDAMFFLVILGGPALAGATWAARNRQLDELRRLSAVRSAQVAAEVEAARLDELSRVASMLQHDVIQSLGAIAMQAQGATKAGAGSASRTLPEIESAARAVLDDLRRHIGVLREPEAVCEHGVPDPLTAEEPDRNHPTDRPPLGVIDGLSALTAVPIAVETALTAGTRGPVWANVALALVLAVPLLFRRRHPVVSMTAFVILSAVFTATLTPLPGTVSTMLPLLLFAHAAGAHVSGWRRLPAFSVILAGTVLVGAVDPGGLQEGDGLVPTAVMLLLGFLAGIVSAARTERVRRTDRLVAEIEHGRAAQVRLAVARQRHAIARDLHDSVAATMTVVCLHAGAARRLSEHEDEALLAALETVATTARNGIAELRDSLEVLDEPAGPSAQVPLRLAAVVDLARASGLDVRLESRGPALPRHLEELVARIVREGLVNSARHAPGATTTVQVSTDAQTLRVSVVDDGRSTLPPRSAMGTGHGLSGLAERVAAHGGVLDHRPLSPRGFRLEARLPCRTEVPA